MNSALRWGPSLIDILCATVFPLVGQRLLRMVETYPPLMYGRSTREFESASTDEGDFLLTRPVIGMAGGSSINSDDAEE